MAKVSKVEAELQGLTKVKPKSGESREDYLKRLNAAVAELDDDQWKSMSTPAMNWSNVATKAFDKDKPIPDFDDAEPSAPAKKAKAAAAEDEDPGEDEIETTNGDGEDADAEDKTVSKTTKKAGKPAKPAKPAKATKAEAKKPTKTVATKKPATGAAKKGDGYKGHRSGSNKETVHKVYDEKGRDAAIKKAASLELADNTARSWISSWGPSKADAVKK